MEILKVVKPDNEGYELSPAACACAGYEGHCATLVPERPKPKPNPPPRPKPNPPPMPMPPPYHPPPFGPPFG